MKKLCLSTVTFLSIAIAVLFYFFVIQGNTVSGNNKDPRATILLSESERTLLLKEMRAFLEALQNITYGATINDMSVVAEAGRKVGRAGQLEAPPSLIKKLPIEFKKLGFSTHQAFDQLALDAETIGDAGQVFESMGTLMANCVNCHAAYQIKVKKP